jgi:hypothetical protein
LKLIQLSVEIHCPKTIPLRLIPTATYMTLKQDFSSRRQWNSVELPHLFSAVSSHETRIGCGMDYHNDHAWIAASLALSWRMSPLNRQTGAEQDFINLQTDRHTDHRGDGRISRQGFGKVTIMGPAESMLLESLKLQIKGRQRLKSSFPGTTVLHGKFTQLTIFQVGK